MWPGDNGGSRMGHVAKSKGSRQYGIPNRALRPKRVPQTLRKSSQAMKLVSTIYMVACNSGGLPVSCIGQLTGLRMIHDSSHIRIGQLSALVFHCSRDGSQHCWSRHPGSLFVFLFIFCCTHTRLRPHTGVPLSLPLTLMPLLLIRLDTNLSNCHS